MRLMRHLSITTLKCQTDLKTDSSEVRNDEGEVETSSAIIGGQELGNPHIQREQGNGHMQILLLSEELSFSKREGFERETDLS